MTTKSEMEQDKPDENVSTAAGAKRKAIKFRKAPQAPKRGKSAFILFSMAKHPEFRKKLADGADDKVPDVAKKVSEAWKNLTKDERGVWEEEARNDKMRYEMEKTMYTGPWKLPSGPKRARKDPDAPKRPMSAFLAYSKRMRSQVKSDHPGMSNIDVSKVLAHMWKRAPDLERKEFIEVEEKERAKYKEDIEEWRTTRDDEMAKERKRREDMARDAIASGKVIHSNDSAAARSTSRSAGSDNANNQFPPYVAAAADANEMNSVPSSQGFYVHQNASYNPLVHDPYHDKQAVGGANVYPSGGSNNFGIHQYISPYSESSAAASASTLYPSMRHPAIMAPDILEATTGAELMDRPGMGSFFQEQDNSQLPYYRGYQWYGHHAYDYDRRSDTGNASYAAFSQRYDPYSQAGPLQSVNTSNDSGGVTPTAYSHSPSHDGSAHHWHTHSAMPLPQAFPAAHASSHYWQQSQSSANAAQQYVHPDQQQGANMWNVYPSNNYASAGLSYQTPAGPQFNSHDQGETPYFGTQQISPVATSRSGDSTQQLKNSPQRKGRRPSLDHTVITSNQTRSESEG